MNIIQPGILPKEHAKFSCDQCKCVFTAHITKEVKKHESQIDGTSFEVVCPCCKHRIVVSSIENLKCYEDGSTQEQLYKIEKPSRFVARSYC